MMQACANDLASDQRIVLIALEEAVCRKDYL